MLHRGKCLATKSIKLAECQAEIDTLRLMEGAKEVSDKLANLESQSATLQKDIEVDAFKIQVLQDTLDLLKSESKSIDNYAL